jgi:hypothetical protein
VTTCSKSCNHKRRETNQEARKEKSTETSSSVVGENPQFESNRSTTNHETCSDSAISRSKQQQEDTGVSTEELLDQQRPDSETINLLLNGDDSDGELETEIDLPLDPEARKKAIRKAEKKAKKAIRRAQREGRGDPMAGQKECDMCRKSVNLLVRCMYKEGQADWEMVCGKCWNVASGGVVDGDAGHPHYRYGGLWKNRRAQT